MNKFMLPVLLFLSLTRCGSESFEPFEFFYSITSEKAVILSLLPGASGVELRTRVYPEDGLIGLGDNPARDDTRTLTGAEASEVQRLFRAVDFLALDDGDYLPPLDASLWAVNTRETVEDYYTVLEPGEAIAERKLSDLVALGSHLWELAGLQGSPY